MQIQVNGEDKTVQNGSTIQDLLDDMSLKPQQIVVEQNRTIVKREAFAHTSLSDGDEIEILHFVGGG